MKHALAILALCLVSCGAGQHPTVAQAEAGLRLACDALAAAHAVGTELPASELSSTVCDVERTSAIMRQAAERAADLREIITVPPDWASLTPAGDAGSSPRASGDAGVP